MTEDIKPGFYWAKVYNDIKYIWEDQIIEYYHFGDEPKIKLWFLCGREEELDSSEFKLLSHNGPLTPPPEPFDATQLENLEPHTVVAESLHHIEPVRDNGE